MALVEAQAHKGLLQILGVYRWRRIEEILAEVSIACSLTSVDDTKAEGACWSEKGRWSVQRNYSCAACKNLRLLHKRALCPSKPHRRSFFFLCLAKPYAMPSHSDPYRRSRPGLRIIKSLFGRLVVSLYCVVAVRDYDSSKKFFYCPDMIC
jgi:hypothetical protein